MGSKKQILILLGLIVQEKPAEKGFGRWQVDL